MFLSNMHWHYWCAKLIKIRRDLYSVSTLLIIIHVTTLGSSLTFELIFLIFKMGIMLHVHVVPSAWECFSPFFHPIYLCLRTAHPSKACSMSSPCHVSSLGYCQTPVPGEKVLSLYCRGIKIPCPFPYYLAHFIKIIFFVRLWALPR